ncbi:MAG: tandem-95 repeat protein, partial [Campylobacterota bacterium]|nr:tandem-95 repeat protein [Campylobacterota bacterium]
HGTVTVNDDGTISYTPDADYNGTDTVNISVTDNDGTVTTQSINLTIDPINDNPVAVDDTTTTGTISLGGSNTNEHSLSDWGTSNDDGSVSINASGVTGTISATNSDGAVDLGASTYGLGAGGNEIDLGETVTMEFDNDMSGATIGIGSLAGRYDENAGQDASVEWVAYKDGIEVARGNVVQDYTDTDGDGNLKTNDIIINTTFDKITFASEAESGSNANFTITSFESDAIVAISTNEDTALTITAESLLVNDTDLEGDTLSISAVEVTANTHGTVSLDANGDVLFTPEANYNGEASFTYTISDGNGGTSTATVTLNVESVNDAPVITTTNTTLNEDTATIIATATDIDGTIDASTLSANHGTVSMDANGNITYTPDADYNGTDTVSISVTDNDGTVTTQSINLTIDPINDNPVAVDDTPTTGTISLGGSNTNEHSLSDWGTSNDDGSVSINASGVTGTISATNSDGAVDLGASTYGLGAGGNEIDLGETVTMEFDNDMSGATIGIGSLAGRYDENAGQDASVEWVAYKDGIEVARGNVVQDYTDTDGDGNLKTNDIIINTTFDKITFASEAESGSNANFTITSFESDAIVAISTNEDTALTITAESLLANDTDLDGDTLSISAVGNATHGTVSLDANGNVVFIPDADYSGEATFEYTISDGNGGTSTATANVVVNSVADQATVTTNFEDTATIIATATDIDGTVTTQSINLTIDPINDNPVAVDDTTGYVNVTTTTTMFTSTFEENETVDALDGDGIHVNTLAGWSSSTGTFEVRDEDGEQFLELNMDPSNTYDDSPDISRDVGTVDGAEYTMDFSYSARPGYDATVCDMELLIDGVVVQTYTADGTNLSNPSWNSTSITFTGTGEPMNIEFREAGTDVNFGRGMFLNDIELTQTVSSVQEQALTTDEDSTILINVLANDTDADGDALSITEIQGQDVSSGQTVNVSVSGTVVGTAQVVNGQIEFTPGTNLQSMDNGESQNVSFEYTVSDGTSSDVANVTINVTGNSEIVPIVQGDTLFTDDFNDDIEGWSGTNVSNTSDALQLTGDTTATKTFDFGMENAGKEVTVSFDASTVGGWKTRGRHSDYFKVEANDSAEINWDRSVDSNYTFTTTVGDDGTIKLDMMTNTTAHNEGVTIDNLTITASGNDWVQNDDLQSAQLVDGIVEGAYYETSSGVSGFTDENGNFDFRAGDDVTFSVGGVVLGVATSEDIASGQTFLQDIADVDRSDMNDEYLENMATFLQSIDTADSGDNIVITEAMRNSLSDAQIDLRTASEEEVQSLVESVGGTYVDEDAAMTHVQEMLEEYTDMDESDFDARTEDTNSAVLGKEPMAGVEYTTSSGETGITDENGMFNFHEGDSITFTQDGEVLSTIDSSTIGDDGLLTLNDLQEFNQEAIDYDNLELDFDNLDMLVDTQSISDSDVDVLEDLDLADMVQESEADGSLSELLGQDDEIDSLAVAPLDEQATSSNDTSDEYCPFEALSENSADLIEQINVDDADIGSDH